MTEPKVKVSSVIEAVTISTYNHITKEVLRGLGEYFINWAKEYGAEFKDEKVKLKALDELAEKFPRAVDAVIPIKGYSDVSDLKKKQEIKREYKEKEEVDVMNIKYPRGAKKEHKFVCEHFLSSTSTNKGQKCGTLANYWHVSHNTALDDCKDDDNCCGHARCGRHSKSTLNVPKTKPVKKSNPTDPNIKIGDTKLKTDETKELLNEKVDQANVTSLIAKLRNRKAVKTAEAEEENDDE